MAFLETKSLKTSASNFHTTWCDKIAEAKNLDGLINWLSAEFVLYQQEENNSFKIYFPNGLFEIKSLKENGFEVFIKSNSKFSFVKIKDMLKASIYRYKHVNEFYEL